MSCPKDLPSRSIAGQCAAFLNFCAIKMTISKSSIAQKGCCLERYAHSARHDGVEAIIVSLRKSASKHRCDTRPGKRRFGLYKYLVRVYRVYCDLHSKRIAKSAALEIAELVGIRVRKNAHPIRILIDASAGPEDGRQKSRWVQALQYVYGWRLPPERVEWCFQQNGGVYGCARKYAALNKTLGIGQRAPLVW